MSSLNKKMDKLYIQNTIQKILNKEFISTHRRRMIIYSDRMNLCCPYCGDGKSDRKKRGNFYFNRLFFICFNCDKKTTFDRMCKDFNEQIDPDKKLEMIEYLDSVMTYNDYHNEFVDAKIENLIDIEDLEKAIEAKVTPLSDFKPIIQNGGIYKYLIGRGINPEFHTNIYQAKYWKNEDEHEWIIIMLNRKGSKILGMQVRNLKEGRKRMFKIYNFENILEWVNLIKETPIEVDINEMVIYNKLSYYFNILNVDFDKLITVFEGYLDSLFYPNSIGLVGVNTDFRFLENNGFELQYFFDNDEAGFKKSEEKLKSGYPIFLWNKLFESIVDKKKTADPFSLLYRISKVKDINKLCQLTPDAYKKLKLPLFFSKDIMDIKWVPKFKYKKYVDVVDYNKKFDNFDKL